MTLFRSLTRHQLAALVATAVDFGAMIALVELHLARPWIATGGGALSGAVTNFSLSRAWAFSDAAPAEVHVHAIRYALVSAGSLALNVLGMFALSSVGKYALARLSVAATVSLFWNFPLHRFFVFREVSP